MAHTIEFETILVQRKMTTKIKAVRVLEARVILILSNL